MLTARETAVLLGVSRSTVKRMAKAGDLTPHKEGNKYFFSITDIRKAMSKNTRIKK